MTPASKKQLSTVLQPVAIVLLLVGAVLMALHGSRFEDIGPYLGVNISSYINMNIGGYISMIGGMLLGASVLLKRNAQKCPEHTDKQ